MRHLTLGVLFCIALYVALDTYKQIEKPEGREMLQKVLRHDSYELGCLVTCELMLSRKFASRQELMKAVDSLTILRYPEVAQDIGLENK